MVGKVRYRPPSRRGGTVGANTPGFSRLVNSRTTIHRQQRRDRVAPASSPPAIAKRNQLRLALHDQFQTVRSQPSQCPQKYRSGDRRRKAGVPLQRPPPGLTAETVIGLLEDAEDYKAFEAAIIADYDAQSAVERELVLRLASLLWRLRRATTMETGLFDMQAEQLRSFRQARHLDLDQSKLIYAIFGQSLPRLMPTLIEHRRHHTWNGNPELPGAACRSRRRPRALLFTPRQFAELRAQPAQPV